jgi:hypothetical protein
MTTSAYYKKNHLDTPFTYDILSADKQKINPNNLYKKLCEETASKQISLLDLNMHVGRMLIIYEELQNTDEYQQYIWLTHNIYRARILGEYQVKSFDLIEKAARNLNKSSKQIHWLWFRKPGYYLPHDIVENFHTWIKMNPEFKFYLWTDLDNEQELSEMLSKLPQTHRNIFNNLIIKYRADFRNELKKYFDIAGFSHDVQMFYLRILEKRDSYDMIFKTDLFRVIVIWINGGIYSDFNDTICLYPMKYHLLHYAPLTYFVGADTVTDANNYFIFCPARHDDFGKKVRQLLELSYDINFILSDTTFIKYLRTSIKEMFGHMNRTLNSNYIAMVMRMKNSGPIGLSKFLRENYSGLVDEKIMKSWDNYQADTRKLKWYLNLVSYILTGNKELDPTFEKALSKIRNVDFDDEKIIYYKGESGFGNVMITPTKFNESASMERFYDDNTFSSFGRFIMIKYLIIFFMRFTNISFMDGADTIKKIPYCSVYGKASFISVMGHTYDATCFGGNRNEDRINREKQNFDIDRLYLI